LRLLRTSASGKEHIGKDKVSLGWCCKV